MYKKVLVALAVVAATPVQALTCEYPEEELYQVMRVSGAGQYDRLGILSIGTSADQKVDLNYTCHLQLDASITCVRLLNGDRIDAITILPTQTLAVHAEFDARYPMKSEVSVENVACGE